MLFNSFDFLVFFIVVTSLYFACPYKFRWLILLVASCYFYMDFVPIYILILGFTIVIDYFAGLFIERATEPHHRKMLLAASIVANVGVLAVFKYFNFINLNIEILLHHFNYHDPIPFLRILLPIGLSFHTFQAMSYTIEVYRGNQKAEKHFGIYSLYVMFYPQLVAGPIERPQNILPQLHSEHPFNYNLVVSGLKLMLWGYFKKLVIADRLALFVNMVYAHPKSYNGSAVAIALVFFAVQIYCDFSGYTDIALGCARVMGFELMTNFNRPFFSRSVTEFWRRWHISLSSWFNDYLFTPLVVSVRNWGKFAVVFSLMVTFLISGVWHGAGWTFVIFGALHGIAIVYEYLTKKFRKRLSKTVPKIIYNNLSTLLTFLFLIFSWIFFRAKSITDAFTIFRDLKSFGAEPMHGIDALSLLHPLIAILILFMVEYKMEYFPQKFNFFASPNIVIRWGSLIFTGFLILLLGVFNGPRFIYFQF